MNYKVYFPKDGKKWVIRNDHTKKVLYADSVIILKESEAVCEPIDKSSTECYILVTGADKEVFDSVLVLK